VNGIDNSIKRYAVDVVVLPPDVIINQAIRLNRVLLQTNPPKIELNKVNCIPHISLSMGVLEESKLVAFTECLKSIAHSYMPLNLRASHIYTERIPNSEKVSGIAIEKSDTLSSLHNEIMMLSDIYLSNDATIDTVFTPPPVDAITLQFINNYPSKSARENFFPHITIGVGELTDESLSTNFTTFEVALFHLGNYCTCRNKIASFVIQK